MSHGERESEKTTSQNLGTLSFKDEELPRKNKDITSGRWEASKHKMVWTLKLSTLEKYVLPR